MYIRSSTGPLLFSFCSYIVMVEFHRIIWLRIRVTGGILFFFRGAASRTDYTQGFQSLHRRPVQYHCPPRGRQPADISFSQAWRDIQAWDARRRRKNGDEIASAATVRLSVPFSVPSLGKRELHVRLLFIGMSSIFDAYDEEFLALTQDIGNNISHLTTYETDSGGWHGACASCSSRFGHPSLLLFHFENRTPSKSYIFPISPAQ